MIRPMSCTTSHRRNCAAGSWIQLALLWAALRRVKRDEAGQAMVESAIVIPLMVFLILGIVQLAMMQHARIMTEYAAFNAARAGIVWNADRIIMQNAALISLLPTYEGLAGQSDLKNPAQMLKRIIERALMYQVNSLLPKAIDLMRQGAGSVINKINLPGGKIGDKVSEKAKEFLTKNKDSLLDAAEAMADTPLQNAIGSVLGGGQDQLVEVEILNPRVAGLGDQAVSLLKEKIGIGPLKLGEIDVGNIGNLPTIVGGALGPRRPEVDFDEWGGRGATKLVIRVRYLYMMRIPFANWIIHQAWLAGRAGRRLYGAIWNPQEDRPGETGFREVMPVSHGGGGDDMLDKLAGLADNGVYMVPLIATYTMRMQSNPYKQSLQVR